MNDGAARATPIEDLPATPEMSRPALPSTTELLLAWDAQRPRSLQTEMGMSKLGSCRRQAGYHLQGYEPDPDFSENKIQAVIGTAIHETAANAARLLIPGAHTEALEVHFAGLTGHPDLYLDGVLRDIKTLGYSMQLEQRRQLGPYPRERWQVHTYGAGLIVAGVPVHTIQIDYVARDSGEEYLFEEPFSADVVGEAMDWLEQVRTGEVAVLPRDYRPESAFCQSCPWFRQCWDAEPGHDPRSVLFHDDPDAARWIAQLEEARRRKKKAEEEIADAQGALDQLRSISRPGDVEDIEVPGVDRLLRFRMRRGRESPAMEQIAMDYKRAGARPPMKRGEPTVSITLVKPRLEEG